MSKCKDGKQKRSIFICSYYKHKIYKNKRFKITLLVKANYALLNICKLKMYKIIIILSYLNID